MTTATFRTDLTVELVDHMGGDDDVIQAMLVSTKAEEARDAVADAGRIGFLMRNRHGTPFEHGTLKFYVEAPITVFREWHRHRIGWSYNEVSGRYRQLDPVFYVPGPDRPLVQVGKPGAYTYVAGDEAEQHHAARLMQASFEYVYVYYEHLLAAGVAKEVARGVLPVNTFTAMFATCNPRSLMAFLALRTDHPEATFPSKPMWEIARCADAMEAIFAELYPLTHAAFVANGRVCP